MSLVCHVTDIRLEVPLIAQPKARRRLSDHFLFLEGALSMSTKQSDLSAFGKTQTEGMLNLQRELLETYEHASRAWLDRVKSEVDLWSKLSAKLTVTHSAPEAMEVYQKFIAERMQMAAEDGKRLFTECQNITQKIAGSLNGGRWPGGM